jgi:hypothetical protein
MFLCGWCTTANIYMKLKFISVFFHAFRNYKWPVEVSGLHKHIKRWTDYFTSQKYKTLSKNRLKKGRLYKSWSSLFQHADKSTLLTCVCSISTDTQASTMDNKSILLLLILTHNPNMTNLLTAPVRLELGNDCNTTFALCSGTWSTTEPQK